MSYTTDRQPQGFLKSDETFLRESLISEIVAINDYSNFLKLAENKEIKDLFYHIMKEEKEHYGLFLEALRNLDKDQSKLAQNVDEDINITMKNSYKEYYSGKENRSLLLLYIRKAIKGELEAIILYNSFLNSIESKKIFNLVKKVTMDEKEHVEELTKALIILDKDEYGPLR